MDLELIIFKINGRLYGIDGKEVIKAVNSEDVKKQPHFEGNEYMIYADKIFDPGGQYTHHTAIINTATKKK